QGRGTARLPTIAARSTEKRAIGLPRRAGRNALILDVPLLADHYTGARADAAATDPARRFVREIRAGDHALSVQSESRRHCVLPPPQNRIRIDRRDAPS